MGKTVAIKDLSINITNVLYDQRGIYKIFMFKEDGDLTVRSAKKNKQKQNKIK